MPLITASKLAEELGVTKPTIHRLVCKGRIPKTAYVQLEREKRFDLDAVLAALSSAPTPKKGDPS